MTAPTGSTRERLIDHWFPCAAVDAAVRQPRRIRPEREGHLHLVRLPPDRAGPRGGGHARCCRTTTRRASWSRRRCDGEPGPDRQARRGGRGPLPDRSTRRPRHLLRPRHHPARGSPSRRDRCRHGPQPGGHPRRAAPRRLPAARLDRRAAAAVDGEQPATGPSPSSSGEGPAHRGPRRTVLARSASAFADAVAALLPDEPRRPLPVGLPVGRHHPVRRLRPSLPAARQLRPAPPLQPDRRPRAVAAAWTSTATAGASRSSMAAPTRTRPTPRQPGGGKKRKGKSARCLFCSHVHSLEAVKAKGFAGEYRDELLVAADIEGDGQEGLPAAAPGRARSGGHALTCQRLRRVWRRPRPSRTSPSRRATSTPSWPAATATAPSAS